LKPVTAALGFCLAIMAAFACASALPPATPETEGGRGLYAGKCHGCHRLYAPSRVAPEKWPALMEKMAVKARLTPDEENQILAYVLAAAPGK
jgi:mono/diheme cytochrome c family protein